MIRHIAPLQVFRARTLEHRRSMERRRPGVVPGGLGLGFGIGVGMASQDAGCIVAASLPAWTRSQLPGFGPSQVLSPSLFLAPLPPSLPPQYPCDGEIPYEKLRRKHYTGALRGAWLWP